MKDLHYLLLVALTLAVSKVYATSQALDSHSASYDADLSTVDVESLPTHSETSFTTFPKSKLLQMNQCNQWEWEDIIKHYIDQVVETKDSISQSSPLHAIGEMVGDLHKNHPLIAAFASLGLIAGGSAVVVPALGVAALNAAGFTAGGVVAGSFASMSQAAVYGGYTAGLFSTLQSIAATSAVGSSASIAAAGTAVGAGFMSFFYGSSDDTASSPPTTTCI